MKIFETCDVISLLKKHDNKKFKLVGGVKNLNYIGSIASNYKGYFQIYDKNEEYDLDLNNMRGILLHGEWEEVKEPVDFMAAFGEWYLNDRNILCILDDVEYRFSKSRDVKFYASQIACGKWYIED